jgi:hypothetical protein
MHMTHYYKYGVCVVILYNKPVKPNDVIGAIINPGAESSTSSARIWELLGNARAAPSRAFPHDTSETQMVGTFPSPCTLLNQLFRVSCRVRQNEKLGSPDGASRGRSSGTKEGILDGDSG